jgi:hypothetical protein
LRILIALAAVAAFAQPAAAATPFERDVGDWQITGDYADDGTGVCIMEGSYRNDTTVRWAQSNAFPGRYMLSFSNPNWRSLAEDESFALTLTFYGRGDRTAETATARVGRDHDGVPTLNVFVDERNEIILGLFAVADSLRLTRSGRLIDDFELPNTRAALDALVECGGRVGNRPGRDPSKDGTQPAPQQQRQQPPAERPVDI